MMSEIINEEFGLYISQREKWGAYEVYGHVLKINKLFVFSDYKKAYKTMIIDHRLCYISILVGIFSFYIKGNSSNLKDRFM